METRRLFRVLGAALALTLAAPAGADLELVARPPGEFVSLGTHRIYYHCVGSGAPLVVIDAGLGGSALEWTPVQERLAQRTRVCAYDRAGYGWSDPGPSPRTTVQAVTELRALLRAAGERPPYLLVGHSLGGFNVRFLAAHHPDEVAALVLVESSHPRELPRRAGRADQRRHGIDVARLARGDAGGRYARAAGFLNTRRKAIFAQMDELAHFADSAAQVRAAGPVPEVPLVVISRDAARASDREREAHWHALQRSLAELASGGRVVIAEGAGHNVHLDRPDVIVREIERLLDAGAPALARRP